MSNIDQATWLGLAVSFILPVLVALVTKQTAHPGMKAVVLLVLSAVTGFAGQWLDALQHGLYFDPEKAFVGMLMSFAVAVLAHLGLLRPINVTGSQGAIQVKVPGGIG